MMATISKEARAYYRGGHRVMMGGVPVRVSYRPTMGGKALMAESSREMCLPVPPRGKKEFAEWERRQLAAYRAADKLGDRSISEVVAPLRAEAPVEPVGRGEPIPAARVPVAVPPRPVHRSDAIRVPFRPVTRSPLPVISTAMKTVHYYRVSTARQGRSGLGLDAQRAAVEAYCAGRGCEMVGEYIEIESGKRDDNRPQLIAALHHARVTGATVIISKLDRLSRNAAFLMTLRDSGVQFVCADMPDANTLTIGIMALVAQQEREATSRRTIEALAAAKARGVKLGNPRATDALVKARKSAEGPRLAGIQAKAEAFAADVIPIIRSIQAEGYGSLAKIADELNRRGIMTARGGAWGKQTVSDIIKRSGQKEMVQ